MNKILFPLLLLAFAAYGQQQMRVAIISTVDNADSLQYHELDFLTGKLREIAGKVLPKDRYGIMTQESIVDRMGSQERAEKECREAICLAELGRKISANYIAKGYIGRFGGMLTIKIELYNSKSGNLVGTFTEPANDLFTFAEILDNKAPDLFKKILEENSSEQKTYFGILEIKPAYLEGVGKNENWSLTINGKRFSPWKNRLSTGRYSVNLSHRCYEDISFDVSITKDGRESFDMSKYARLKEGYLALTAEKEGYPVNMPVFVNGQRVGETPFNGSVAVCSEVAIGIGREKADVRLEHKQTVEYVHIVKSSTTMKEEIDEKGAFEPSSVYLSFSPGFVDSRGYENLRYKRTKLTGLIGIEFISNDSWFGAEVFFGGGALGDDIGEFIMGAGPKMQLWILEKRIAFPISVGFAYRRQWSEIENTLVAEFINEPRFQTESVDYLNSKRGMYRNNFDIMPTADLQFFFGENISLYVGYMYRISFSGPWYINYKVPGKLYDEGKSGDSFDIPDEYNSLRKSKEHFLGIPGAVRAGLKFHFLN